MLKNKRKLAIKSPNKLNQKPKLAKASAKSVLMPFSTKKNKLKETIEAIKAARKKSRAIAVQKAQKSPKPAYIDLPAKGLEDSDFLILNQEQNLILEEFLVEIENEAVNQGSINKPLPDELSRLISSNDNYFAYNKKTDTSKKILPEKQFKVSLDQSGNLKKLEKTYHQTDSVYLIDLKSGKPQIAKTPNEEKVYETGDFIFEVPKATLLERKRLIDKLDDFGFRVYGWYSKIFKQEASPRKKSYQSESNSERIAFNLRLALNFALIGLLLVLPIRGVFFYQSMVKTKGNVLGFSEAAWEQIKQGAEAAGQASWEEASLKFNSANAYFSQALVTVQQYNQLLLSIIKAVPETGDVISSGENLLVAGKYLSFAAQNLSDVFAQSEQLKNLDATVTDGLVLMQKALAIAKDDLQKAIEHLSKVDPGILPQAYREELAGLQQKLPEFQDNLNLGENLLNLSLEILGHDTPKRFLFMFQNTNELRATGGFFGSMALVDIDEGKIVKMEVPAGGPYDLKGYFTEKIISPQPLQLVGSAWEIWDANWWPDFPTSAKKIVWFLEKSEWPSVDGVIAFNSSMIAELLKVVGNIEMPDYDKVLTPDNVVLALQHATLFEYDKFENKPKQIIGDLMPILIEKLIKIEGEKALPLLLTLNRAMAEKDIQFYFTDEKLEKNASSFGITGELSKTDRDYLMVVDSNIAGGKTNGAIKQQTSLYSYVQSDGSVINTVAVTRTHEGDPNDVFERVNNVSYLRVYVPSGATLLEVTGYNPPPPELFKEVYPDYRQDDFLNIVEKQIAVDQKSGTRINNELGKTSFGNWIQVEPGQSKTITFSYKLPFKISQKDSFFNDLLKKLKNQPEESNQVYSLLVQKQSGVEKQEFKSYLYLPDILSVKWLDHTDSSSLDQTDQGTVFETSLDTDQSYAVLLE